MRRDRFWSRLLFAQMNKRTLLVIGLLLAPVSALGQASDGNWARVDTTVTQVFDFTIDSLDWSQAAPAQYDFGTVSHQGTNGGVKIGGRVYYTKLGAFTWRIVSGPRRSVDIVLKNPSKTAEPPLGGMALDQLAVEMTIVSQASGGVGTSLGLIPVAPDEILVDNVLAGYGSAAASGEINLEIHVDGNDKEGLNSWLFELEATGI